MVYLDNSATTRVDEDVAAVAKEMMLDCFANPASLHYLGSKALERLSYSRFQIAQLFRCQTEKIHFCSSGTEASNAAIFGIADDDNFWKGKNIVITGGEHASIIQAAQRLNKLNCEIRKAELTDNGRPVVQRVIDLTDENTALVCMMAVNNETGAIFPAKETAKAIKQKNPNTLFLCDMVQAFGKMPINISETEIDFASISGHKIHAPKGSAALYSRKPLNPQRFGGSQESKLFPGTENTPSWVALGQAANKCLSKMKDDLEHVKKLNKMLRDILKQDERFIINSPDDALPYVLNFSIPGFESYKVTSALSAKDIFVSSGAACERGAKSHVLVSMGLDDSIVSSAIRVSLSRYSTEEEIEKLYQELLVVLGSIDVHK